MISTPTTGKPDFVGFMAKHFSALVLDYESLNRDGSVFHRGAFALSGFVIEIQGDWFWVTAGHCLNSELDERIEKRQLRLLGAQLMDCFGTGAVHLAPIPMEYTPGMAFNLEPVGFDFALLPLNANQRRLLEANNVVPITRKNWLHQHELSFEQYKMLGVPETEVYTSDDGNVELRTAIVHVQRTDEMDEPVDAFVGRLHPEVKIETIKGMSGGPIYGFRRDESGNWYYHVVALQSKWNSARRTITGCSLPPFAEAVTRVMTEASSL